MSSQIIVDLFTKLAQIDSPSGAEKELSAYVVEFLKGLGLEAEVDAQSMIYCRVGDAPKLLLCAHLDTVEPGRGVKVMQQGEYLTSAGDTVLGADNKASLAAILSATEQLLAAREDASFELLFTVREETNSGIKEFDMAKVKSKLGMVFDVGGGDLGVVSVSAPFINDFSVEITGKGAHASRPEDGVNALAAAAELIRLSPLGRVDEYTTLNFGRLEAGEASNTVPARAVIEGDLRSTSEESFEKAVKLLEKLAQQVTEVSGCQTLIDWQPYAIGYSLKTDAQDYKAIQSVYEELGIDLKPIATTSASDAGFLNSVGITCYCLGDGAQDVHTTSERIKISSLEKLVEIVKSLVLKFNS